MPRPAVPAAQAEAAVQTATATTWANSHSNCTNHAYADGELMGASSRGAGQAEVMAAVSAALTAVVLAVVMAGVEVPHKLSWPSDGHAGALRSPEELCSISSARHWAVSKQVISVRESL